MEAAERMTPMIILWPPCRFANRGELRYRLLVTIAAIFVCLAFPAAVFAQQVLDVACFRGGYGIDFYQKCAVEFEKLHPGVRINVEGSPRIWDQLTPRFAAGTPPDLCFPGWGMNVFSLISEGQLLPLDKWLDEQAYNTTSSATWRSTFIPSLLAKGSYQGKCYTIPFNFDIQGWFYNKKMFREHGWSVPQNYDELLTLCAKIKKSHIAPITFTGRYPQYMLDGFFFPWAYREGGQEIFNQVDRLAPGAWSNPAFLKSAESVLELKHRGFFQSGCIGMTHMESQMEFLVGRAAMIPNGTWLYSEMRMVMPPDFEMDFMLCPVYNEGKGGPTAIKASYDGKGWCIPSKAKNPELAAQFLKFMTSADHAREFMKEKLTLMAVKDLGEGDIPPHLRAAMRIITNSKAEWDVNYAEWYPELGAAVQNGLRNLYNEVLTPKEFLAQLDQATQRVRNDPNRKNFGPTK
jgi:N-acetylglucosamine transport system substrate-binding protein